MKMRLLIVAFLLLAGSTSGVQAQEEIRIFGFEESYLGVHIRDVSADNVRDLGLPREAGVFIERVQAGSPAASELQEGDVITQFANVPVYSVRQFQRVVAETPPGRAVEVVVIREGRSITFTVTTAARESGRSGGLLRGRRLEIPIPQLDLEALRLGRGGHSVLLHNDQPQLGIQGGEVTEQLAETLAVPEKGGILVMQVMEGSPAERAGLRAGDVITAIDGQTVKTLPDLRRHLGPGTAELEIVRDKRKETLTLELGGGKQERHESIRL